MSEGNYKLSTFKRHENTLLKLIEVYNFSRGANLPLVVNETAKFENPFYPDDLVEVLRLLRIPFGLYITHEEKILCNVNQSLIPQQ